MSEWSITNVSQKKIHDHRVDLSFEINANRFSMMAISFFREGEYQPFIPQFVFHDTERHCPFCPTKNPGIRCAYLESNMEQLFLQLIAMPSIRLEWVYLPHPESDVENGS